jgi:hypothetical protein
MTEIAYECQRIHVTMTHWILYLKTGPRPTSVTKVRHGTQLLKHASNSFGCIRIQKKFKYKNDYTWREAPRYSNKKQGPQREALWHSNKKLDTRREAPMRSNKKLTLGVQKTCQGVFAQRLEKERSCHKTRQGAFVQRIGKVKKWFKKRLGSFVQRLGYERSDQIPLK